MANYYPQDAVRSRRVRNRQLDDFLVKRGELRFMGPHFDPLISLPAAGAEIGEGFLPVLARVFPWLGLAATSWLLYEMLKKMLVGVQTATGYYAGGWTLDATCHGTPNFAPGAVGIFSGSTGTGPNGTWVTDCNSCLGGAGHLGFVSLNTLWHQVVYIHNGQAIPSGANQWQYYQTFHRVGTGSVAPYDFKPIPMEIGRTWPLGDPGADPYSLPSVFPLLAPLVGPGTVNPIPFPSIPEFDRMAEQEWSPWIQREVGPGVTPSEAPWSVPDEGFPHAPPLAPWWQRPALPTTAPSAPSWVQPMPYVPPWVTPWMPPQVDPSEPSPVGFPPVVSSPYPTSPADPGAEPSSPTVVVEPAGGGSMPPTRYTYTPPDFRPPPPRTKEKKLKATPRALIHLLMASTYAGGFTRDLWKSLPKSCRSKSRTGKIKYSTMLNDIYKCIDQVDWQKFGILAVETTTKYGLEGKAIRAINAAFPGSSGFGLATNLYHTAPYLPDAGGYMGPSSHGGAFSGRADPFGYPSQLLHQTNVGLGIE